MALYQIVTKKKYIGWAVLFCCVFSFFSCSQDPSQEGHPLSQVVENFHLYSFYAGTMSTAAEFVSYGCKQLALSPTMSEAQVSDLIKVAETEAKKYGIPIFIEKDLLVTKLFSPTIAKGKTVILFAYKQDVLDKYHTLKEMRKKAENEGRLAEVEDEIAWQFGRLLSYTDETIQRLLSEDKSTSLP